MGMEQGMLWGSAQLLIHWDAGPLSVWTHPVLVLGVGGWEDAVRKPVSQCCLNIVDNSVKFLFMTISV